LIDFFLEISEEEAKNMDSQKMECLCGIVRWNYFSEDINVYSSKIMFKDYIRPGTITSACVQKENNTNKTKNAIGKFSINHYKAVYPKSNIGWLNFLLNISPI